MSIKTTIVLLIAVLLAGAIWFFAGDVAAPTDDAGNGPGERTERRFLIQPRLTDADIIRLTIELPDEPRMVFERTGERGADGLMEPWRMVEPLDSATETELLSGITVMLSGMQTERVSDLDDGPLSLADAGLEQPRARFTMTTKNDRSVTVAVGDQVALSDSTYVRVADAEQIAVVGRDLSPEVERTVSDYRAKRLINPLAFGDATRVRVIHEGTRYVFTRAGQGDWRMEQPVQAFADARALQNLVSGLSRVRVDEFVDDTPDDYAAYGLVQPQLAVEVTTQRRERVATDPATQPAQPQFEMIEERVGLSVGEFSDVAESQRFIRRNDARWVATASVEDLKRLIPDPEALRDLSVTRLDAAEVQRLSIRHGDETVTLQRTAEGWTGNGDLDELEPAAINDLLEALEDARALDVFDDPNDPAEYGLDAPRAELSVATGDAPEAVRIEVGALSPSARNAYVRLNEQPAVYVLTAETVDRLVPRPLALRSREITSLRPEYLQYLRVQRPDRTYELERNPDGPGWQMLVPENAPADRAALREMVNDLARLRAREVVSRGDVERFGLADPTLVVEFEAELPPEQLTDQVDGPPAPEDAATPQRVRHTLRVSNPAGAPYATFDDSPYVYELDPTVWGVLNNELLGRGLFEIEASAVERMRIVAPGGVLEFAREGDDWKFVPDPTVALSNAKVDELVQRLANLQAQAFIAYREGDLARHNLEFAPVTVTLRTAEDETVTLHIDQVARGELPRKAAWVEQQRIFLMRPGDVELLLRGLDAYARPTVDPSLLSPAPAGG